MQYETIRDMKKKETKTIHARYHVADCEHNGDMRHAESYISNLNPKIKIDDSYWNGIDCGEAYIDFSFPSSEFVSLYKRLYDVATFDADINDYVSLGGKSRFSGKSMSIDQILNIIESIKDDISDGWETRIPMLLFFKEDDNVSKEVIFSKCLEMFSKYNILGYNRHIAEGEDIYHYLLFTCNIKDITKEKMESFADYELIRNRTSFFGKNNIYGALKCKHIIKGARKYSDFKAIAKRILEKKPLPYVNSYISTPKILPYAEYAKRGKLKYYIENGTFDFKLAIHAKKEIEKLEN